MDVEAWYRDTQVVRHVGLDVRYRRQGAGEALVCLHGFPTSSWDFAPMWSALTQRYSELVPHADVVILDDLGHYPHVEDPAAVLQAFLAYHG